MTGLFLPIHLLNILVVIIRDRIEIVVSHVCRVMPFVVRLSACHFFQQELLLPNVSFVLVRYLRRQRTTTPFSQAQLSPPPRVGRRVFCLHFVRHRRRWHSLWCRPLRENSKWSQVWRGKFFFRRHWMRDEIYVQNRGWAVR